MSQEQARARELANRLLEKAKSIEAERQRQRREQEEAQREQEEAEMLQAQRERLREQAIQEEVSRKLEKERLEQEQIEDAEKTLGDKLKTAEAILQQKQGQYLVSYMAAPAELDSQMDNFAKEWMDQIAKVKDPEMHERLLSNTGAFLELMREKFKQNIEEKLKKQASECYVPYVSPF